MESFKIVIDGRECEAYPGETVLEVAERNGITIPVFCYHRELRPEGACRVCLVEIEGAPRLVTACTLKAMPDMVVKTDTERVRRARAGVIELILNNHTLECPICDKSGECELQMTGFRHGPKKSRYKEPRREKDIVIQGPLIEIDNDRCILCRRCIRMCGENMGNRVLGILNRGYRAYISPFNGDFMESGCEHCGSCVDVCPVGSLLDRAFKYKDRPWRMDKTWTTCLFCGSGCKVEIDSYHGKVKRAVGRIGINDGHNRGYLCVRGKWGWDVIYSDKRLKEPLLRVDGELRKVSLDEAVKVLKEKIEGRKINLFLESSLTNEELERIAAVFGTENATADSLGFYNFLKGFKKVKGTRETDKFSSIYDADAVVVIGDFIEEINPVVSMLLRLAVLQKGKRLLRIGVFPSKKLDSVAFSKLLVDQTEIIDTLKHVILGMIDTSYSSGNREVDTFMKSLRDKKIVFVVAGMVFFSPEAEEIGKTVAYLSDRVVGGKVVAVPPKANSLGVVNRFELKSPGELDGSVNVVVNGEMERDFPGVEFPKAEFTVLFTPFYIPDVSLADLVIPTEVWLEKEGTVDGVDGTLEVKTVLEKEFSLLEVLSQLPVRKVPSEGKTPEVEKVNEPGQRLLEREKGELLLTVLPNRTGWNSVSYYSENVMKVAGERILLLNPEDFPGTDMVKLKVGGRELLVSCRKDSRVPKDHALLRVERFTRDIAELLEGQFPNLTGIKCQIAEA